MQFDTTLLLEPSFYGTLVTALAVFNCTLTVYINEELGAKTA